tara:strand:- start:98 stop:844 length:747 start_codon:yes stop_codon:yes gene_type:complete
MLRTTNLVGFGTSPATPYACDAVVFENDSGKISSSFSGPPTDTKYVTISFWYKSNQDGSDNQRLFTHGSSGTGYFTKRSSNNKWEMELYNNSNVRVFDTLTSSAWLVADGWTHFFFWYDSDTPAWALFKDGVDDKGTESTFTTDGLPDWSQDQEVFGAYQDTSSDPLDGDIADFYMTNELVTDITKFAVDGKPVNLGADGSLPSGTSPVVFLHVDVGETANNFLTNAGTGGNYVVGGALATASTSPTD